MKNLTTWMREVGAKAICLIPKPGKEGIISHERDFCGCEMNKALGYLQCCEDVIKDAERALEEWRK